MLFQEEIDGGEDIAAREQPDEARPAETGVSDDVARERVAELISHEIPFLRRIVRRWHRDPADAEDLLQDTIVRVLANAESWQVGTSFRAWAFTIMRNQFRANWGRAQRNAEMTVQMGFEARTATDDISLARLTIRDVQAALNRLPAKQREAIVLAGVEGKSYEAVAIVMGISVGAVRCHLARARERLRAFVLDEETTSPCARKATDRKLALVPAPAEDDDRLGAALLSH
ncbi:MAG TPA: RNA polymerase sigma factor [Aliidongia sp.]|nr:RNA polymerase sigma factor [Aliidongia sp.]